jgi:hypothetical protein
VSEQGGQISEIYLQKILAGECTDPAPRFLRPLARYFGVSMLQTTSPDCATHAGPARTFVWFHG